MAQLAAFEAARQTGSRGVLWRMIVLLCGVYALATLDRMVVVMLVPGIKASLHVSDTLVSLLNGAAFAISNAVSLVVCGVLADRSSRRNMLLFGAVGWSLATIAGGFAQSYWPLLASRIAVGTFQAVVAPAALAMMASSVSPEVRGRAMGIVVSGSTLGAAMANFGGGGLLQLFSHQPLTQLPFGIALAPWQMVLVICGLLGLLLAPFLLTMAEPPRAAVAAGVRPRVWPYITEHRATFILLFTSIGFFELAALAQASWTPVILLRIVRMPPGEVGVLLGVITLASAAVSAIAGGHLSDAFVRRDPCGGRVMLLALVLPMLAVASLGLLDVRHPTVIICAFAFMATVATFAGALLMTILSELTPSALRGQILAGYAISAIIFGSGLAPTVVALITDQVLHDENRLQVSVVLVSAPSFLIAAGLTALALPGARRLRERIRHVAGEA